MGGSNDHHSTGAVDVAAAIVGITLAFIVVVARMFTRAFIVKQIGAEDWVILVSLCFSIFLAALIVVEVQHGEGRHIETVSDADLKVLLEAFWASVPVYQLALTLTKISILLQYWRVFVGKLIRLAIKVLFIITVVYGTWSVLSTLLMCLPVSYFWDPTVTNGHCLKKFAVWFTNAGLNIVTDIAIFVVPMPVLKELQLPKAQRMALMIVFGLGSFVCLISILRLKSLYEISIATDTTWVNGAAAAWSSLEVNVGIICASLPTLRKPISRCFPRLFTNHTQSGNRRYMTGSRLGSNTRHTSRGLRSTAQISTDSNVELATFSNEKEEFPDVESGNIRVITVTTQEYQAAGAKNLHTPNTWASTSTYE